MKLQTIDGERIEYESRLCDQIKKGAELTMMKVIHDIKNPILAIEEIANDEEADINDFQEDKPNLGSIRRGSTLDQVEEYCVSKICNRCKNIFKNLK